MLDVTPEIGHVVTPLPGECLEFYTQRMTRWFVPFAIPIAAFLGDRYAFPLSFLFFLGLPIGVKENLRSNLSDPLFFQSVSSVHEMPMSYDYKK